MTLTAAAAPVGLFAVGPSLTGVKLAGDLPQAGLGTMIKLLLMPVTAYTVGRFVFDLPLQWLGVVTLFAALPAGMIPYTFALSSSSFIKSAGRYLDTSTNARIKVNASEIGMAR